MENRAARTAIGGGREFASSISSVIRSEIKLAKAEARLTYSQASSDSIQLAVFGFIAALAILPLIAFAVIGFGRVLNDNYWLSSLIIGLLMAGVFGWLALSRFHRLRDTDLTFPRLRESFEADSEIIERKVNEFSLRRRA